MSEQPASERSKKKRFRSDGTSIWQRRTTDGPGIWATCVKGKERYAIAELHDVLDSLSEELWPLESKPTVKNTDNDNDAGDSADDVEGAIAREISSLKRPRQGHRFTNCPTNTQCLLFLSCAPPIDPVKLVQHHVANVERTGITRTRHTHRLIPVSGTCDANLAEITSLCKRVVVPAFESEDNRAYRYRVEIHLRSFNALTRDEIIKTVAKCIPPQHQVDLQNAELFILVELFKSVCSMSAVRDFYRYKKFNLIEIAQARGDVTQDDAAATTAPDT